MIPVVNSLSVWHGPSTRHLAQGDSADGLPHAATVHRPNRITPRGWRTGLFLMALMAGLALALPAPAAAASTRCVNPSHAGCYHTIGDAVAAAAPWDTIEVAAGTYREGIVIGKPLILVGAGAGELASTRPPNRMASISMASTILASRTLRCPDSPSKMPTTKAFW